MVYQRKPNVGLAPVVALVLLILLGGCMSQATSEQRSIAMQNGRDFRDLSIFPNSEELLLVEVNVQKLPERSRVLRYNLKQNTLQHYALPKGYVYSDAKLSPSGKYIVMKRLKDVIVKDDAEIREALSDLEIVIMKPDGTDLRVFEFGSGYRFGAVLSNDDSKIAFWRGSFRKPGSKTLASQFNIWEFDLKTGKDARFAGNFDFFEGGQMQYLPGDNEILFQAYGPSAHALSISIFEYSKSFSQYEKQYNHSQVYRVTRGQLQLPAPILTEIYGSSHPMRDLTGNLYFRGAGNKAISLFRKTPQGEIKRWIVPQGGFASFFTSDVAPNGEYITFIYSLPGTRHAEGKLGIGMLNIQTSEWKTLSIPPLESSTPIVVKLAH